MCVGWYSFASMCEQQLTKPIVVVNVVSVSYSGSTWANLLIGSHSEAICIGELDHILKMDKPICTMHPENCPVWSQFDPNSDENLYVQLSRISGKRFLIVNNTRKFLDQQVHPDIDRRFMFMVRDGRAVTASALRKNVDLKLYQASRWWSRSIRGKEKILRSRARNRTFRTHYEIALKYPEPFARSVCQWLGTAYQEQMNRCWEVDHHFIGGSRATLKNMTRDRNQEIYIGENRRDHNIDGIYDPKFYDKVDPGHFVDERWKSELSPRDLRWFGFWAGRMNHAYGYPNATDLTTPLPKPFADEASWGS